LKARKNVSAAKGRSSTTVGAPIIPSGTIRSRSSSSSGSITPTGPWVAIACCAVSLLIYGSPPPPPPSTDAPAARSSISSGFRVRTGDHLSMVIMQFADRLNADTRGVSRQIAQRYLFHVDHPDRRCVGAGAERLLDSFFAGLVQRLGTGQVLEREDSVGFAADPRDRRPDRVGDGIVLRHDDLRRALDAVLRQDAAAADDDHRQP